jgi:hypothetical protein
MATAVHIMGSRSYHDMAAFWPFSDMPIAPPNAIVRAALARASSGSSPDAASAVPQASPRARTNDLPSSDLDHASTASWSSAAAGSPRCCR